MNRLQLVNAMFSGAAINIPMTDGYGVIKGCVMSMTKEDGSGQSWIVVVQQFTPYGYRHAKLYMRTQPGSYACRLLESKRVAK